ncbi:MAG: hypothetical protein CM15mP74_21650 [Halieaceae bacterium]|nr:MAG: hypothetical protein CM15mP74_21650 [Halieaceae bacterium]
MPGDSEEGMAGSDTITGYIDRCWRRKILRRWCCV